MFDGNVGIYFIPTHKEIIPKKEAKLLREVWLLIRLSDLLLVDGIHQHRSDHSPPTISLQGFVILVASDQCDPVLCFAR